MAMTPEEQLKTLTIKIEELDVLNTETHVMLTRLAEQLYKTQMTLLEVVRTNNIVYQEYGKFIKKRTESFTDPKEESDALSE